MHVFCYMLVFNLKFHIFLDRTKGGFMHIADFSLLQDPLVTKGASFVPLLGIDVWEHAYYLQVILLILLN